MSGALLISERLYGALLHLYPQEFRAAYGQQMRLTFRDACRKVYYRNGAGGLLVLWLPTLLDLFKSAIIERSRQGEITMTNSRRIALAGPLTILAGLMWVVSSIGDLILLTGLASSNKNLELFLDEAFLLIFSLSFVPMVFALIGIRLDLHHAAGIPARLGLTLSVAGCVGMIVAALARLLLGWIDPELVWQSPWMNYITEACLLSLMIGYILFGIDALRYKLLPRWNLLPLLAGSTILFWFAITVFGVASSFPMVLLPFIITGVCWVLLGLAIKGQRQVSQ